MSNKDSEISGPALRPLQSMTPRLGVNIDHIATLRQLRGTPYPNLMEAAEVVQNAGAEQITVHLREDRRHIQDEDVRILKDNLRIPLNLEMAVAEEIVKYALKIKPAWCCLVPEKRKELTTEGGLNVKKNKDEIKSVIKKLKKAEIKVSLFVEPSLDVLKLCKELDADAVEIHTGTYCNHTQAGKEDEAAKELRCIAEACNEARKLGLKSHAGHGIDYENIHTLVEMRDADGLPLIEEYNIGHSIVCRAAFVGLDQAVREIGVAVRGH